MARKGLGKGLDSLIPDYYDEDFDSNSPQSLEDMLNEKEDPEVESSETTEENIFEQLERENAEKEDLNDTEEVIENVHQEENQVWDETSEDIHSTASSEEGLQTSQEVQIQKEHVAEVKEIVDKNPRITLWSSRSSAVFRYLRKT